MSVKFGLGSWTDAEYVGLVFPKGTPPERRLSVYAEMFDHVEVNSSYYATPRREVVARWAKATRPGFTFHVKLHRLFSQSPAKTATESSLPETILRAVAPLRRADKLGVFLLVLPPSFRPERRRLEELDAVAKKFRPHTIAVELRHSGWVEGAQRKKTFDYFRAQQLVWVGVDMPRIADSTIMPPLDAVTHKRLAYLRLHGRNPEWLQAESAEDRHLYEYPARELKELSKRTGKLASQAEEVHVVANNHARDYAPKAALALKRLLETPRRSGGPRRAV